MSSSSYEPVAIGIPVSNPYPSLPYSRNFPNEPDTESSQLVNNHAQYYYPQQYGHGQQSVPGQFHGPNQQSQFIVAPVDPERIKLGSKIADIDKRLDSEWYFVYKVLLWLTIIGSAIRLLKLPISYILTAAFDPDFKWSSAIIFTVGNFLLFGSTAWTLQNSLVFKNAMNDKSLEGARKGFKSMVHNSIYFVVISIIIILALECGRNPLLENLQMDNFIPSSLVEIIFLYAPFTLFGFWATKKIVELLEERETIVQEVKTRFGVDLA